MTILPFTGFRPAAFTFLRGLKRNNNKVWFDAHREQYETEIKAPLRLLVDEVDARLGVVAPEVTGNARSLFRLHRDVRFSKDKSPYNTHAAAWFYHRDASHGSGSHDAHGGAGFYFRIEPKASMSGGGIWMPPAHSLKLIRQAIDDDHETLQRILADKLFRRMFGELSTEAKLKRSPRGYQADNPALSLLLYKSFTATHLLSETEVMSKKLPDLLAKQFQVMLPFVRWLNGAIGLRAHARR